MSATAEIVNDARKRHIGVAALNVIQLEHAEAVVAAAEQVGLPVILQLSENAVRYHGALEPIAGACRSLGHDAAVPVGLHLDHATSQELCSRAMRMGFDSVMIDASKLDWHENVRVTREVAVEGRARGVWVEAELGEVGGKSAHDVDVRTDPDEARAFVDETGVDGLAVAVGSSHAMVERGAELDLDLLRSIRERVDVPLVLHGSSGLSDDWIVAGIRHGLTKINVGTQLNIAMTSAIRDVLAADDTVVDPRRYLGAGRSAVATRAAELLRIIASESRESS